MEEKVIKLKHVRTLRVFLLLVSLASLYILYSNLGEDFYTIVQVLQDSSSLILIFLFIFIIFNIKLIAGDSKVRKVFDHLIFFSFIYYILVNSISIINRIDMGTINDLSSEIGLSIPEIVTNHLLITILIPLCIMITIIWSFRNIRLVGKEAKKESISILYYLFIGLSIIGLVYSIFTPLYSLY